MVLALPRSVIETATLEFSTDGATATTRPASSAGKPGRWSSLGVALLAEIVAARHHPK
jgi:hypothetical protein